MPTTEAELPKPDAPQAPGATNRRTARHLYWQGWRISSIAQLLGLPRTTVHGWKDAEQWDKAQPIERVEGALEARLVQLIGKECKTGGDFKEIDLLGRQVERLARVHKYQATGKEADLNPNIDRRNEAPKKKPKRNVFDDEQTAKLLDAFRITQFAFEACGVALTGDPIVLSNGAQIHFLGTNARTAQGYHGNFYFDEFFWTHRFEELNKVASGMAMHKQWRKTYFSTPSSIQHEAYAYWSGDRFNKRRAKADRIALDLSHARVASGFTGEDKVWRNIVTILDALEGGCDLFDIDELRLEYNADEFENLLMCGFIDDTQSVFPMSEMQACMVDSWVDWGDYKPFTARPFGYRPVWVGYDPSHTGDSAGLVVLAPPEKPGGTFRVLERLQWRGLDFEAQAEAIRQITLRYNVTFIGIDTTGLGQGVFQLVTKFYPAAKALNYSLDVKTRLVLKAKSVISKKRLQFDAGWVDLAHAFLAIRKTLTASGRNITFEAGRTDETGHADLAWACMHALDNEPLEGLTAANRGFMEISG